VVEMSLLEDLKKSLDSIQDYTMGVEIFEDGYRGEIHVYDDRGRLLTDRDSDFLKEELEYVSDRIATIVSRYREIYRYSIVSTSRFGGSYITDIDSRMLRDVGVTDVERVYSDLDSLSIQFSADIPKVVISKLLEAYEFNQSCREEYCVSMLSIDSDGEYSGWLTYWGSLLSEVVDTLSDVLKRFYVNYVGLLTNNEVRGYMLKRYSDGYVSGYMVGRYHQSMSDCLLHVVIDLGLFRLRDIDVDAIHGFTVEDGVIDFNPIHASYKLKYITDDIVGDFCDMLEMVAYVHDAVVGYYKSNIVSLYRGYVLCSNVLDTLPLCADEYTCMAERFVDEIGSVQLDDYYEFNGCVFSYDDNLESIEMYIPIRELSTKVMASRVFNVGKFMWIYLDMIREYSKGV
jgi:hypothetical protein